MLYAASSQYFSRSPSNRQHLYACEGISEVVQARNQQLAAEMQVDLVSMEQQLVAVTSHNSVLRQELELTRQLVVDKEQLVQESQQNLKEVHAALSAEVADKQDHVVQLLQRVQQLEEECRQAKQQVNLHNDVIKSITKKAESYKSRLAVMESLPCEVASNSCVQYQLRNKKSVQNATYARDSSPGPSSQREPPTKDVKQVDLSVCLEQNVLGNFTNTTCNTSCISRG